MLPLNEDYLTSRLKQLRTCRTMIQEKTQLDSDRLQSLLQDLLEAFIEITEHLCSRMERSKSPTYRERVRQLGKEGLFETDYIEEQLVPLAWFYENRVGLHIPLKEREIKEISNERLDSLERFEDVIQSILEENQE